MSILINPFRFAAAGGDPTIIFAWDPENDEAVPGTVTFTRASEALFRNDSGIWEIAATGVIRAGHNAIPGGGGKGFISEPAATNLALHRRDFTDAVWVATNITPVQDATGIDGVANAASTLTATANNGTIFQTVTSSNANHSFQVFVARVTGTGTIEITLDGGSTFTDITSSLTSSIDNPFTITQLVTDPSFGFRMGTSGDVIEADVAQTEKTAFSTTPIIGSNPAATATRVVESFDCGVDYTLEFSADVDITGPATAELNQNNSVIASTDSFSASAVDLRGLTSIRANVGGAVPIINNSVYGVRKQIAMSAKDDTNSVIIVDSDGNSASSTPSSSSWDGLQISLGKTAGSNNLCRGVIHNVTINSVSQTESELQDRV